MIDATPPGSLDTAVITGQAHAGLTITTADGQPAQLAIIDEHGQVIEAGPQVARVAWQVSRACLANFMRGQGYLRVASAPPGDPTDSRLAG